MQKPKHNNYYPWRVALELIDSKGKRTRRERERERERDADRDGIGVDTIDAQLECRLVCVCYSGISIVKPVDDCVPLVDAVEPPVLRVIR
jgi:hypothetical protein